MGIADAIYNALASFTCPRAITFIDWRLGFTHKALMVAILGWVIYQLFVGQLFLEDAQPLGLVSVWGGATYSGELGEISYDDSVREFYANKTKNAAGGPYAYCDNPSYNIKYDEVGGGGASSTPA